MKVFTMYLHTYNTYDIEAMHNEQFCNVYKIRISGRCKINL